MVQALVLATCEKVFYGVIKFTMGECRISLSHTTPLSLSLSLSLSIPLSISFSLSLSLSLSLFITWLGSQTEIRGWSTCLSEPSLCEGYSVLSCIPLAERCTGPIVPIGGQEGVWF